MTAALAAATHTGAEALALGPILLPCDFSTATAASIRAAAILAGRFGAEIVALHVIPSPLPASGGFRALPNPILLRARLHDDLKRALDGALEPARADAVVARAEQREGKPADEILALCSAMDAGLIVIGTHGRRAIDRALVGSVAETVLRRATCPVLAVPPFFAAEAEWPRTVLWANERSSDVGAALAYASAIAAKAGAALVPARGVAPRSILGLARRCGADLVVLGASRPGRIRRVLPRSAVLAIVREAPCPVLVVRRLVAPAS